ncbi:PAS domain S-box protein, partial [candidate division KSB1 bacterium]
FDSLKLLTKTERFPLFFVRVQKGLLEICGAPLQPTSDIERETDPQGWFFVGSLWSRDRLDELALLTSSSIRLIPANIAFTDRESDYVALNTLNLPGWNGQTVVTLSSITDLSGIKQTFYELRLNLIISVLFLTVIIAVIIFLLFRYVSIPLRRLSFSLETGSTQPLKRLIGSKTEFGKLSALIVEFFDQNDRLQREITQREKSETALREGEKRFRDLADLLPLTVFETDEQGTMTFLNGRAVETVGITREQVERGLSVFDLVHPEDRERARESYQRVMNGTVATGNVEFLAVRMDGTPFDCFAQVSAIVRDGKIAGVRGFAMDITERKQGENALRHTNEMLNTVFTAAPLPIFTVDINGCVSDVWNPACEQLLGWSHEEVRGGFLPIVPVEAREFYMSKVKEVNEGNWMNGLVVRGCLHNGSLNDFAVYAAPLRNSEGRITGSLGILVDLAERLRSENAVREANDVLRTIIDTVPLPICTMDGEGRVGSIWNPAAERMFGWSKAEVTGQIIPTVPEEIRDQYRCDIHKILEGKIIHEIEVQLFNREGNAVYGSFYGAPLRDAQNNITSVITVLADLTERRKMELALRESEERFRNLSDTAPVLIWMGGVDRHCYYFNKTWLAFTGRSLQQEYGKGWLSSVHPDDAPRCLETYRSAFAMRRPFSTEFRLKHADGTFHWILDRGAPRFTPDGAFTGYIGTCTDITDRRQAEEAMRESEERFRAIFETAHDAIFIRDGNLTYTHVNPGSEKFLGFSMSRVIGKTNLELYGEAVAGPIDEQDLRVLHGETTEEESTQPVRGVTTTFHIIKVPLRDRNGRIVGICGIARDITARKRAETELDSMRQMLQSVLDNIPARVFWKDRQSRFLGANAQLVKDAGLTSVEEMIGKDDSVMPWRQDAERFRMDDRMVMESGIPKLNYEEPQPRPDGSKLWLQTSKIPMHDSSGKVIGILGTYEDITERKRVQEELTAWIRRYEMTVASSGSVVYDYDINSGFLEWGGSLRQVLGYEASQTRETLEQWVNRIHPDDRDEALRLFDIAQEGCGTYDVEYRYRHEDGHYLWMHDRGFFIPGPDGQAVQMLGMMHDITERRKAEQALRENEEYLRTIFNFLETGMMIVDAKTHEILDVNPTAERIFGIERDRILHHECHRFICPAEKGRCPVSDLGQTVDNAERTLLNHKGESVSVLKTVAPISLSGRSCLLETFVDITERKNAEEKIAEWNRRFEAVVAASGQVVYEDDIASGLTYWSGSLERVLGYSSSKSVESVDNWRDRIHPDDRTELLQKVALAKETSDSYDLVYRYRHEDGHYLWVQDRGFMLRDENGTIVKMLGMMHDITQQRAAEEIVREKTQAYRMIADYLQDVVWKVDCDLRFTYISPSVTRIFGYSVEEAMSRSIQDVLTPDSFRTAQAIIQEALQSGLEKGFRELPPTEFECVCKDGSTIWTEITAVNILDEKGRSTGMIGISRNISERRRIEEQLRLAATSSQAIVEAAPLPMIIMSLHEKRVIFANAPLRRALGLSENAEIEFPALSHFDSEEHRRDYVEVLRRDGCLQGMQVTMKRADGTPVTFIGSVRMFDYNGEPALIAMAVPVPDANGPSLGESPSDSPATISHHLEMLYAEIKDSLDRARQHISVSDSHNQPDL